MLEHAIWWHVYPLGACGAPIRGERDASDQEAHRLRRLLPWLDHFVRFGANGLLLGPIFESTTHGYDTVDHHRIDSRLGTEADFDELVAAASERGIRNGERCWVVTPTGARLNVQALVTARVGPDTCWMPFHFSGRWQGQDMLQFYPAGAYPVVRGEAVNTATTYGYDSVTMMQETKTTICNVEKA